MKKELHYVIGSVLGILLTLAMMYFLGLFIIPLVSMVLGFYFLGLALPEMADKWIGYGHTIWFPVGFSLAGILGTFVSFGMGAIPLLVSLTESCSRQPCLPLILLFVGFTLGSLANFYGYYMVHGKIDLLGEHEK